MIRTLIVDNYDSFTLNLFHCLAQVNGADPVIVPNDWGRWHPDRLREFDNVVISPGPGTPVADADFGICAQVIAQALTQDDVPVLGICLGHQGIAHALGAQVVHAPEPRHGRASQVVHSGTGLFDGIPSPFEAVRYHSLAVAEAPGPVRVTARADDGVIMGLEHTSRPLWGVQFHPESVLTEYGERLLANFAELTRARTSMRGAGVARISPRMEAAGRTAALGGNARTRLAVRSLPLTCTAARIFETLYGHEECAVWLDGNLPGDERGRFSVMGAPTGPRGRTAFADVGAGTVTIREGACTTVLETEFFTWLGEEMRRARAATEAPVDLPFDFTLGWVGYLGYELKSECGSGRAHRSETPDAAFAFLDRAVVVDNAERRVHLLALAAVGDVEAGGDHAARWLDDTAQAIAALPAGVREHVSAEPVVRAGDRAPGADGPLVSRHPREQYLERIREAQRLIGEGETYEVCLTNMVEGPADRLDPWSAYTRLRRESPSPFGAYLRFPRLSVLSTSPERFLRISGDRRVESTPIKGTRPRGRTAAEDAALRHELATAEKDRSENLMIVDLVRHDLGRTAETGSVRVDRLFDLESYATVHQLVSTVSSRLAAGTSPVDCVRAAFPPGSMTGAPKIRTMSLIDELEDGPRGVYSGAIGYFSLNGAVDLSVVIRTLVITPERFRYGVGGAIVALSDPQEEYEETIVKAAPLLRLLGRERF